MIVTKALRRRLLDGMVIPAHPLALTSERRLDERRQRALGRYYLAAGAGGLAVGVHTTQFAIREDSGLHRAVLEIGMEAAREDMAPASSLSLPHQGGGDPISHGVGGDPISPASWAGANMGDGGTSNAGRPIMVAGVCGRTDQALREASMAADLGYDAALVSLAAFGDDDESALVEHCARVGEALPIFGFYLQAAVGGRLLSRSFWARLAEVEPLVAIKVAPFNRYQTLDVLRAVADSGRSAEIALYTGNDDHIVEDLLMEYRSGSAAVRFDGGLLGQWAVGTRRAVELLHLAKAARSGNGDLAALLRLAPQITDTNAALFDAANGFRGCIAGIHEALVRQGLMAGRWCLDPHEDLSPGQSDEITRVLHAYPHLHDDAFIAEHLDIWMR